MRYLPKSLKCLFCVLLVITAPSAAFADITVFAAASLKEALDQVARKFEAQADVRVTLSYAGSSTLARQIEFGAPVDIFISANAAWMDSLSKAGILAPDSRVNLLGNSLVLIGPATASAPLDVADPKQFETILGGGKLAMALVEAVPAGIYGKAALVHFGLWDYVSEQVAQTDNVRAAMALVALGAAPLGVVYKTDAMADTRVAIKAHFPAESHSPIIYPAAITAASQSPDARAFLDYLQSPGADDVFASYGFTLPAE